MHKFYFMRHAMQERKNSLTLSTFCFPKISENFSCSFCLKSKREKLGNPEITAYMHEIPRKKRTAKEVLYLHNSDFRKKSGVFCFPFFFLFLQNVELSRYFLNEDLLWLRFFLFFFLYNTKVNATRYDDKRKEYRNKCPGIKLPKYKP